MHAASEMRMSVYVHEMMMRSENRILLEHAYGLREQQVLSKQYACPCRNGARSCFFLNGTEVADAKIYGCKTYLYRDRAKVWRGFSKTLPTDMREWLDPIGRLAAVLQEVELPTERSRFRFGVRLYFFDVKRSMRRECDMFWEVPLPRIKTALVADDGPNKMDSGFGDLDDKEDDDNDRARGKRLRISEYDYVDLNNYADEADRASAAMQRLLIVA